MPAVRSCHKAELTFVIAVWRSTFCKKLGNFYSEKLLEPLLRLISLWPSMNAIRAKGAKCACENSFPKRAVGILRKK
ncbi:hypothetical protein M513_04775 [Trichuris suis]|uniref:Uncharacterized protein n=1 Tax=Trichuris suis TaxID=68888 RepID=A0A085MB36_9BILA|nr:hypothetical protein M513_04775 [Trichuris suis]